MNFENFLNNIAKIGYFSFIKDNDLVNELNSKLSYVVYLD